MSARKEPCFWSRDIERHRADHDRRRIRRDVADAPAGRAARRSLADYLQSRVAIPDLLAARPDVRLIAMIRNPVEMVASRHANLLGDYQ